ncbi:MAG: hypothetical protein QM538_06195 [Methylacidiphilales bacterium]|nr:hypothetical protein [Candidatus Methylacidiphilales bacterium]
MQQENNYNNYNNYHRSNNNTLPAMKLILIGLLLSSALNTAAIDYINLNVNHIDGENSDWKKKVDSSVKGEKVYAINYWTKISMRRYPDLEINNAWFIQEVVDQLASNYKSAFARGINKDLIRLLAERHSTVEIAKMSLAKNDREVIIKGNMDSAVVSKSIKDFTLGTYDRMKRYQENPASCVASGLTCYADFVRLGTISYDDIKSAIEIFKLDNTIGKEKEFEAKKLELLKAVQESAKSIKSNLKIAIILECKDCVDKELRDAETGELLLEGKAFEQINKRAIARTKYNMQDLANEMNKQLQKSLSKDLVGYGFSVPIYLTSKPEKYESETLYLHVSYTVREYFINYDLENSLVIAYTTLGVLGSNQSNYLVSSYYEHPYLDTPIPVFGILVPKITKEIISKLKINYQLYNY